MDGFERTTLEWPAHGLIAAARLAKKRLVSSADSAGVLNRLRLNEGDGHLAEAIELGSHPIA